jgi:hypothetical protein
MSDTTESAGEETVSGDEQVSAATELSPFAPTPEPPYTIVVFTARRTAVDGGYQVRVGTVTRAYGPPSRSS